MKKEEIEKLLETCSEDPIHQIGSIQPNGKFFIFNKNSLVVEAQSLEKEDQSLIGKSWKDFNKLCDLSDCSGPSDLPEFLELEKIRYKTHVYFLSDSFVVELEEIFSNDNELFSNEMYSDWLKELLKQVSPQGILQTLTEIISKITKIDRVMGYQFDTLWHGHILAETKRSELESYLNWRYPSTDIPEMARKLYYETPYRILFDLSKDDISIAASAEFPSSSFNLSQSLLRGVHPIHRYYLTKMGVRGTLVFPIRLRGKLWGLLSCHHYDALKVNSNRRDLCLQFVEIASTQILKCLEQDERKHKLSSKEFLTRLKTDLVKNISLEKLSEQFESLQKLSSCDGLAIIKNGVVVDHNLPFGDDEKDDLLKKIVNESDSSFIDLSGHDGADFIKMGSAICLRLAQENEFVVFWRRPMIEHAESLINKEKVVGLDKNNSLLSPSVSFTKWKEAVGNLGRPFTGVSLGFLERLARTVNNGRLEILTRENKELALNDSIFRNGFDNLKEGMIVTDAKRLDNPIIYANKAFLDLCGYDLDFVLGRNCRFLNEGIRDQEQLEVLREAISKRRGCSVKLKNRKKDGSLFINQLLISPIIDRDGNVSHFIGIQNDITEMSEMESLLMHKSRLTGLGELAASMGHEINNPLAIALGKTEIIKNSLKKEDIDEKKLSDNLASVKESLERIASIVQGLSGYTRKYEDEQKPIDMVEVVKKAANFSKYLLKESFIELDIRINQKSAPCLGHLIRLEQVLVNLIKNARDALQETDSPKIILELSREDEMILVTVTDNGPGIDKCNRDRLFDAFFTTKGADEGTGLGLSICKKIMKSHDGDLELVDSNIGAAFRIKLPYNVSQSVDKNKAAEGGIGKDEKLSILVVDDEPALREILKDILEGWGHKVEEASNGIEALVAIEKNTYSHIISDLKMPRMDGGKLIRELRSRNLLGDCKFVLASGALSLGKEQGGNLKNLIDLQIKKPYDLEELKKALKY